MNKPIVGITMGDPAGSGPEITIKALADPEQYTYCRPIVVGDVKVFEQARKFVGREDIVIHRCDKVSDALFTPGTIDVLHLDLIEDINKFEMAKVSVEGGNAAFQCVKKVIELAMAGEVDATCTNALNKEAMNKALEYYHGEKSDGYTHFDGHTEIYATYTHTKKYTMMLAHHDLRVVHVSTHVSLREACDRVKKDRVLEAMGADEVVCPPFSSFKNLSPEDFFHHLLMDTLRAHTGHCVGLAANMIGVNKRIIVVDGGGVPFPMLNPVIRKRMGEPYEAEEGCLSHSGTRRTLRYPSIEVEFQNLSLQTCRQRYSGFLAQIIQHELDHCEGVLI